MLANADIAAGTSVDSNGVAFTTLDTPITLTAGTQYFIGAIGGTPTHFGDVDGVQWGSGLDNFAANSGALTTPGIITLDTSGYSSNGPFTGADTPSSVAVGTVQDFTISNVYFAGDLRYAVPEPSNFSYLAVGGLVVAFLLRRKICR